MIGSYGRRSKWVLASVLMAVVASILVSFVAFAVLPGDAIDKLKEGNARFCRDILEQPNTSLERVKETSQGQKPFAVVLTCSDSRVPPEIIFDRGVGDLFVVRDAGNVTDPIVVGSIEYAVEHLHTPLVIVLGHTKCGAVGAAVEGGKFEGGIGKIVEKITPSVVSMKSAHPEMEGDVLVNAVVQANIANSISQIEKTSKVLKEAVENDEIKIVGAVYDVSVGKVTWLDAGGHDNSEKLAGLAPKKH